MFRTVSFLILVSAVPGFALVVSYEGNSFPEDDGWQRRDTLFLADRWLEGGWFVQHPEIVSQGPPQVGEEDLYEHSLASFAGDEAFFIEWRMETDGTHDGIPAVAPAALVASGFSGILYHFTIAEDQVLFRRDTSIPSIWIDIAPGVPHTYRLELYGAQSYSWSIDGQVMDAGVPEGAYPSSDSRIVFGARAAIEDSTTRWDYIRFGVIPEPSAFVLLAAGVAVLAARHRSSVRQIPHALRHFPHR